MAERVRDVRRPPITTKANRETDFVYRVGGRVSCFRKQAGRFGEQPADQLRSSNGNIREECDDNSARAFSLLDSSKSCGGAALGHSSQYSRQVLFL